MNKAIKIIGIIAFVFSLNFGNQVYRQAEIAEEFMQLPISCEIPSQEDCGKLIQDRQFLLAMWDGNLRNDFIIFFLFWVIYSGSLIYTTGKSKPKAT